MVWSGIWLDVRANARSYSVLVLAMTRIQRTRSLILAYLYRTGKPTRYSEIKKAVLGDYPEAGFSSAIENMKLSGAVKRVSFERDGKYVPGRIRFKEIV